MGSPRVLVVEHQASCPPRLVGDWLEDAGCTLEVCRPYTGADLPDLTSYDAAAVLGGEMSANDDDEWSRGRTGTEVAIRWNNDVVVAMPEGAAVLARSPGGEVQVARFGPRAWGIQAHPEADPDVVRRWAESDREDHVALGLDQDAVLAAIEAAGPALARHWRPRTERFAAVAAGAETLR